MDKWEALEALMDLEARWRDRLTADEREMAHHLEARGWAGSLNHDWRSRHLLTFRWSKEGEDHADSDPYPSPAGLSEAFRQASRRTGQLSE